MDGDSFSECNLSIGGCQMKSTASRLPDGGALLMPVFLHSSLLILGVRKNFSEGRQKPKNGPNKA